MDFQNLNKLCIVCDIQPAYASGCHLDIKEVVQFLKQFNHVLYFFNDHRIGCDDTEETVRDFLKKEGNATDDDLKHIRFQPKVFWYMRDILDMPDVPYEDCVKLLRLMILRNVEHANQLSVKDLVTCLHNDRVINLITHKKKNFYYDPKIAAILSKWRNAVNIGGFENQCNLELQVYLDALDVPYEQNFKFIY